MSPSLKYTNIKNCGIEWIMGVPSHWNVRTLYQLVTQVKDKNSDLAEQNLLSLSYGKIKRKDINSIDGLLPASFDAYNIIETGDIVLRLTDLQNDHTSLRVGLATERGIITSAYTTLRPFDIRHSKYLYYLLHAFDIKKGFYGMGAGVRQGLNYGEVKELRVVLPEQNEQDLITEFLDNQCEMIDSIIADTKNTLDDYKKWKASVIYEIATKGLSNKTTMNESGIPWVGRIPKHWTVSRVKTILRNVSIKNHPEAEVLSLYRDYGVIPKKSRDDNHNVTSEDTASYKFVQRGNLVINKMKAWQGSLAVSEYEGIISPAYYVCEFISDETNKKYIHYLLRCKPYAQEFERLSTGMRVGQWDLGLDDFMRIPIVTPSPVEQAEIVAYLDSQCAKIDEIIFEKEALIGELETYKKSLIYEVVTGKRKVV